MQASVKLKSDNIFLVMKESTELEINMAPAKTQLPKDIQLSVELKIDENTRKLVTEQSELIYVFFKVNTCNTKFVTGEYKNEVMQSSGNLKK